MALSLIAAAAVMITLLSPCLVVPTPFNTTISLTADGVFAFSRLLAVAFAIHMDMEFFLGVGLSNFGMVVHGSFSFLFCSTLHPTLVISFQYRELYNTSE